MLYFRAFTNRMRNFIGHQKAIWMAQGNTCGYGDFDPANPDDPNLAGALVPPQVTPRLVTDVTPHDELKVMRARRSITAEKVTNKRINRLAKRRETQGPELGGLVGGHQAKIEAVPWTVFISIAVKTSSAPGTSWTSFQCTGGIIARNWIITAYHCILGGEYPRRPMQLNSHITMRVFPGVDEVPTNTFSQNPSKPFKKVVDYYYFTFPSSDDQDGVALLKLAEDIDISETR